MSPTVQSPLPFWVSSPLSSRAKSVSQLSSDVDCCDLPVGEAVGRTAPSNGANNSSLISPLFELPFTDTERTPRPSLIGFYRLPKTTEGPTDSVPSESTPQRALYSKPFRDGNVVDRTVFCPLLLASNRRERVARTILKSSFASNIRFLTISNTDFHMPRLKFQGWAPRPTFKGYYNLRE